MKYYSIGMILFCTYSMPVENWILEAQNQNLQSQLHQCEETVLRLKLLHQIGVNAADRRITSLEKSNSLLRDIIRTSGFHKHTKTTT